MHMVEFNERGVTLSRLAFGNHCELCDAVQRHGNADEADDGPLASRACKVQNTVCGLGETSEERPERGTWCDTFPAPCSRSSTSKARECIDFLTHPKRLGLFLI